MISAVYGKLLYFRPPMAVISTSLGLDFEVIVSAMTLSALMNLSDEDKKSVRLATVYFHNEETALLYGFFTDEEKELFTQLIRVNGIGAKQAMKILSSVTVDEFKSYLSTDNIRSLSKIPGIGLKTASRIILDLKSKLVKGDAAKSKAKVEKKPVAHLDAIVSLTDMGYDRGAAEAAVAKACEFLSKEGVNPSDEKVFMKAFQMLSEEWQKRS